VSRRIRTLEDMARHAEGEQWANFILLVLKPLRDRLTEEVKAGAERVEMTKLEFELLNAAMNHDPSMPEAYGAHWLGVPVVVTDLEAS